MGFGEGGVLRMSSAKPWIPFYVSDYRNDIKVQALSFEDKGLYTDMLFLMWENGGVLPGDLPTLAKIFKLSEKKFAKKFQKISFFFQKVETDGEFFLTQKRLKAEYEKSHTISDKRRRAVGSRADRQETQPGTNVPTNEVQSVEVVSDLYPYSHSHSHSHNNKEINIDILRPDEAPGEILTLKAEEPKKPPKPKVSHEPLEEWFEKFYTHYPRKDDRKRAHTAFMAIFSKSPPSKHRAIMENLVLRLTSYVDEREKAVEADPSGIKFTKLPATWLRAHDFTIAPSEGELLMKECWEPVAT